MSHDNVDASASATTTAARAAASAALELCSDASSWWCSAIHDWTPAPAASYVLHVAPSLWLVLLPCFYLACASSRHYRLAHVVTPQWTRAMCTLLGALSLAPALLIVYSAFLQPLVRAHIPAHAPSHTAVQLDRYLALLARWLGYAVAALLLRQHTRGAPPPRLVSFRLVEYVCIASIMLTVPTTWFAVSSMRAAISSPAYRVDDRFDVVNVSVEVLCAVLQTALAAIAARAWYRMYTHDCEDATCRRRRGPHNLRSRRRQDSHRLTVSSASLASLNSSLLDDTPSSVVSSTTGHRASIINVSSDVDEDSHDDNDFDDNLDNPDNLDDNDVNNLDDSTSTCDPPPPPTLLSLLLFSWMHPVMSTARAHGTLDLARDLPRLPPPYNTARLSATFAHIWRHQAAASSSSPASPSRTTRSLLRACWHLCGWSYLSLGALKFVSDLLAFSGPILLNALLLFIDSYTNADASSSTSSSPPALHGFAYAALLSLCALLSSVLATQYSFRVRAVSLQLRTALLSAVFDKSLRISNAAMRAAFSAGTVTNLMSVDTERIMDVCVSFHEFWSLPVQIGIALYLLYAQVGVALLAGLAVVLVLIPINGVLTKKISTVSRAMMRSKDERVQMTFQLLQHVRVVKMLALESRFVDRILALRRREMRALTVRKYLDALCVYFWATTPVLVSLATFAMYVLTGSGEHTLTAARVFTCLALFNTLITPLNAFPWVINGLVEGRVSAQRVRTFLNADEKEQREHREQSQSQHYAIRVQGSFAHDAVPSTSSPSPSSPSPTPSAPPFHLADLHLTIERGEFVGVCGPVASGKSSLLLCMLGELEPHLATASSSSTSSSSPTPPPTINGSIAYVSQHAWIQNATIRDNICFGRPYDHERYVQTLAACALVDDLKQFPASDLSEIGEGGINVSGGQAARIALARAVYHDCDVYLLDDPLSAVDVHVGTHIVQNVLCGMLAHKTRVLVTHHEHFLHLAHRVVHMADGRIVADVHNEQVTSEEAAAAKSLALPKRADDVLLRDAPVDHRRSSASNDTVNVPANGHDERVNDERVNDEPASPRGRLTTNESRARGAIRRRVLRAYVSYIGAPLCALIFLSMVLMQGSRNTNDWWLADWSQRDASAQSATSAVTAAAPVFSSFSSPMSNPFSAPLALVLSSQTLAERSFNATSSAALHSRLGNNNNNNNVHGTTSAADDSLFNLKVLFIIAAFNSCAALFRAFIFAYGGLVAARSLFRRLLVSVVYAPVTFFDENPVGRILNRFSSDLYAIDEQIPFQSNIFLAQCFLLLGALVMLALTSPLFLALIPPLGALYFYTQRFYRTTSRELRRLDSVSRSPLYSSFSECLTGATTIRAFVASARFAQHFQRLLDANQRVYMMSLGASQWLGVRLQAIGVVVITLLSFASVVVVVSVNVANATASGALFNTALVGLALAYTFPLTGTLNALIGSFTDTEKEIVSLERTIEYLDTPSENPAVAAHVLAQASERGDDGGNGGAAADVANVGGANARASGSLSAAQVWPSRGHLEFRNVMFRYRADLPDALCDVSLSIPPGEHVGIVGRTGSGKSSLFQALFCMRPLRSGAILIDGRDISSVPLDTLRSHLAIVPQRPTLFDATVRENVDVRGLAANDEEVWRVLEQCRMADRVRALKEGLDTRVSEETCAFSVGQMQLLCFARALLAKARILVLDEASSSMDASTDASIQAVIKSLRSCTVLVIAHRVTSVMSMHRVIVMERGQVIECGAPSELCPRPGGAFAELVQQSAVVQARV